MPFEFCIEDCKWFADEADGGCESQLRTLLACEAQSAPEDLFCYPYYGNVSLACDAEDMAYWGCVEDWYMGGVVLE